MELVSNSHHKVYFDKLKNEFIKISRGGGLADSQLIREYEANIILKRKCIKENVDGELRLITPNLGRPLIHWDEESIYKALKVIDGLPKYEGNKIEKANKLPQLIKQSIIDRDYNISTILLDNMDGTIFDGDYLIHRDPHIKNWVIDQDDNLMLIDWEAALIGNKDLCRANFIFGLVDQGFADFVKIVNNEIIDFNVAKQLLVIKTLSSMSWAYWNDGFETPERQLFIGLRSIFMLNEK